MAEVIRMPRMSDTMEEGNIIQWLKKVGDKLEPGDILAEVETDKATMELENYHEGTLLYIGVKEGAVPVDGILAVIGEEGEDYEDLLLEAKAEDKKPEKNDVTSGQINDGSSSDLEEKETPSQSQSLSEPVRIKASPLAKKMASESNIPINQVRGTGESGRIVKRDIEQYLTSRPASTVLADPQILPEFDYGEHPVSQMRKTIAKRLVESKFSSPHFYLTIEINMDKAIEARNDMNEISETRISFNDLIIKACCSALRKHPKVNSSWLGDRIAYHRDINIGVAVAVEEGLVVPVLRNTDLKSLSTINAEVRELAGRARNKKLQLDEMQGNTFTISNLGMFGIEEFTAIINPPDSCILAVGSIMKKPVVQDDGEIRASSLMKVTMSCDHRTVDGATGAQFLQSFKSYLENPVRILI